MWNLHDFGDHSRHMPQEAKCDVGVGVCIRICCDKKTLCLDDIDDKENIRKLKQAENLKDFKLMKETPPCKRVEEDDDAWQIYEV